MIENSDFLPSYCLPTSGRGPAAKHKKARPPAWSLRDLADHLKIPQSTIATRAKKHPLPNPIASTMKGNGSGLTHPCALYTKQSLVNWHLSWMKEHAKI